MLFYYQMCLLWLDHSLTHFHAVLVYFWNWAYRFWLELFFLESTYMANLCQVNGDSDFWNKAGRYIFLLRKLLELHTQWSNIWHKSSLKSGVSTFFVTGQTIGGNSDGSACMFPFIYEGVEYTTCIDLNHDKPWCSTTESYDDFKRWGECMGKLRADQISIKKIDKTRKKPYWLTEIYSSN